MWLGRPIVNVWIVPPLAGLVSDHWVVITLAPEAMPAEKIHWTGILTSVQPRIRLSRSFDERQHSYLGYVLRCRGVIGDEDQEFSVAIGKAAQEKHQLRVGDEVIGASVAVGDSRMETAELYKTSGLRVLSRAETTDAFPPPWTGAPPSLDVFQERRHRRLSARTYTKSCITCQWGCLMPVEMIIDHWNPSRRKYRTETFCYGPKACSLYSAGPNRKVPGRNGMSYVEEDWVDEEEVSHRGPED